MDCLVKVALCVNWEIKCQIMLLANYYLSFFI
jgi:hypothetical protein